jgi:hypothetical protein
MQADNSEYIKGLDQATAKLSQFSKDQSDMLGSLAEKLAGAFTVGAIVEFTASAIEGAASMERMSESTGIAVEALSGLRLAAAASGLDADGLGTVLKKLNVNIAEAAGNADSKAGVAFRALGIDVRDANGNMKDASTVISEMGTKFAGMADGPNKVAFAVALLGKQGQSMIPVLNKGAEGLAALKDQATAAGIVMSGELAKSAEEFSQKMSILKATMIDGLKIQIAEQFLPVLNELMNQFTSTGGAGSLLATTVGILVDAFKWVAVEVIEIVAQFEMMGKSLGALGAEAVAVAHGHFAEAADIFKQNTADNEAIAKSSQDRIVAIWKAGGAAAVAVAKDTGEQVKTEGKNLAAELLANAADIKLENFAKGIEAQSAAFGLGGAALVRYKLSVGDLALTLSEAGAAGKKAAADAISFATALQTKKDDLAVENYTAKIAEQIITLNMGTLAAESYKLSTGAIGEELHRMGQKGIEARDTILALTKVQIEAKNVNAIQQMDDDAQKLSGHLVDAATHAFDLQHLALSKDLSSTNNSDGQAKLEIERDHIINVAKINELNLHAAEINATLAATESKINLERTQGQISDLTAQAEQTDARSAALVQLQGIYVSEQQIAAAANDPALVDGVKKFGVSIDALKGQTTQLTDSVRNGLEQSFGNNFSKLITGAESFRKAVVSMLQDIEKQFADLIAKNFAQQLFAPAGGPGGSSGGMLGGLAPMLAGLFAGGGSNYGVANATIPGVTQNAGMGGSIGNIVGSFAEGGTIPSGKVGIVGENGPEYAYSGAADMQVVPSASTQSKNVSVTNHFTVEAPGGTISRQSQMQMAAAAARSIGQANHRNNS